MSSPVNSLERIMRINIDPPSAPGPLPALKDETPWENCERVLAELAHGLKAIQNIPGSKFTFKIDPHRHIDKTSRTEFKFRRIELSLKRRSRKGLHLEKPSTIHVEKLGNIEVRNRRIPLGGFPIFHPPTLLNEDYGQENFLAEALKVVFDAAIEQKQIPADTKFATILLRTFLRQEMPAKLLTAGLE